VATDDPTWQARAGEKRHSLYFHFLPELVAAWFNTRNSTYDVVKPERGRYARATWRGEAGEPSVCLWDEFTWTDFGAGAVVDSKQDGGDAFELYCRVKGITRAKAMRLLASEVLNEAKVELEAAALEGRNPARWVFDITSPAGWKRYDWLV
jgi:hypothetical protein